MCARLDALEPVEIVVVHFDQIDRLAEYRSFHEVPDEVRIVGDPDLELYNTFDIGRGSWWRVWGPRTFVAYAKLLAKGAGYDRNRGDSLQLGGDVVIAADGTVAWTAFPDEPDARPSVAAVIDAVDAARRLA